jgi:hypothetical protein
MTSPVRTVATRGRAFRLPERSAARLLVIDLAPARGGECRIEVSG